MPIIKGDVFIRVDPDVDQQYRIRDNLLAGDPSEPAHIHISRDRFSINNLFMCSLKQASEAGIVALFNRPRGIRRRAWTWVAKFALSRTRR